MNAFTANFNGHSLAAKVFQDAELEMGEGERRVNVCVCCSEGVCVGTYGRLKLQSLQQNKPR